MRVKLQTIFLLTVLSINLFSLNLFSAKAHDFEATSNNFQNFFFTSPSLISADLDDDEDWLDEDDEWLDEDEDWLEEDDEDWLEEDEDEEATAKPSIIPQAQPKLETTSSEEKNTDSKANNKQDDQSEEVKTEASNEEAEQLKDPGLKDAEQVFDDNGYKTITKKLPYTVEELKKVFSVYGDSLDGLNPENPRDLEQIGKLIEIVGIPKFTKKKHKPTLIKARKEDPIVNFSARSISVRDAFATLARISGKSITVSGSITDRDFVSVVEINDEPFTSAFLSLVEASGVDFSARGDNFTVLKKRGANKVSLLSSLNTTDLDLSLPLEERYADLIYDNQDISSIIKDLANKYGVDIVMTATPTERVTIRVTGVNIEDAFELIFAGSKFSYTRKNDAFIVYSSANKDFSLDKKTIFFPLKYLEAKDASKLLPGELKNLVKVSDNQNAFIAEGSKPELTKLFDFIRTIDKPIPQVEVDVKLVEVSTAATNTLNIYQNSFVGGRMSHPQVDDGNAVRGFDFRWGENQLSVFNERPTYVNQRDVTKIKVDQKLLVVSGKSAKINFDQDTNIVLNSAGTGGNASNNVVQNQRIQRITAGNSMTITPIVGGGGVVTTKVEVEVSANGPVNTTTGVPSTTVRRRISSDIQINNNETIAIGGLFNNNTSNNKSNGIPFLDKIPLVGSLFKNTDRSKNESELLILITPRIKNFDEEEEIFIQAGANNY